MNMLTCVATVFVGEKFDFEANQLIKTKEREGWYVCGDPIAIGSNLVMFTFKQPEQDELEDIPDDIPEDIPDDILEDIDTDNAIERSVRELN